jgi:DNA-binding NarL/FixJ family response regulator
MPQSDEKIGVVIVDDQTLIREGLRTLLEDAPDLEIVGVAADGLEAISCAGRLHPDLMILDESMPTMNGTEAIKEIKRQSPHTRVLMLTAFDADQNVVEALAMGADGFASKFIKGAELRQAIDIIMAGKQYISPSIAARFQIDSAGIDSAGAAVPTSREKILTKREREILKLIAEGHTNTRIADMLHISAKTVDKHRSNLMSKLNIHNVQSLTMFAVKIGLLQMR